MGALKFNNFALKFKKCGIFNPIFVFSEKIPTKRKLSDRLKGKRIALFYEATGLCVLILLHCYILYSKEKNRPTVYVHSAKRGTFTSTVSYTARCCRCFYATLNCYLLIVVGFWCVTCFVLIVPVYIVQRGFQIKAVCIFVRSTIATAVSLSTICCC